MKASSLRNNPEMVETVAAWIQTEWGELTGRTPDQTMERFAQELYCGQLPYSIIAIEDNRPTGIATLRERDFIDWLPGQGPWICNVYVPASQRGKKIASTLCKELIQYAENTGFKEIFLTTAVERDSLYHRLGFTECSRTEIDTHSCFILRWKIREDGENQ